MAFLRAKPDSYIEYFIRGNGVFMRPAQITPRREIDQIARQAPSFRAGG